VELSKQKRKKKRKKGGGQTAGRMAVAIAAAKWMIRRGCNPVPVPLPVALNGRRCYGSSSNSADATAIEMVNYARAHSRPPNVTSYPEVVRVLEQGLSIFKGDDASTANASGRLLLEMATLKADRGDIRDAAERLKQASDMTYSSIEIRVAALEALTGLHLRMHQDVIASDYGDRCLHLLENAEIKMDSEKLQALEMRAKAIKGLVELACGRVDSAESYFAGWNVNDIKNRNGLGAVALAYAEFIHVTGNFPLAKQLYELALELSGTENTVVASVPSAAAMVLEEVQLGAACALGQLATHSGHFDEAEQRLTQVLKKAEEYYGGHNQKVGIVLLCIAEMFGHKGRSEGASYFLIQEGLYRRSLEMLKAPSLDQEGISKEIDQKDVIALARGGYAQLLSPQRNRAGEAEKMKEWAVVVWENSRTTLEKVLEKTETSIDEERKMDATVVTDMRLGRVF